MESVRLRASYGEKGFWIILPSTTAKIWSEQLGTGPPPSINFTVRYHVPGTEYRLGCEEVSVAMKPHVAATDCGDTETAICSMMSLLLLWSTKFFSARLVWFCFTSWMRQGLHLYCIVGRPPFKVVVEDVRRNFKRASSFGTSS